MLLSYRRTGSTDAKKTRPASGRVTYYLCIAYVLLMYYLPSDLLLNELLNLLSDFRLIACVNN